MRPRGAIAAVMLLLGWRKVPIGAGTALWNRKSDPGFSQLCANQCERSPESTPLSSLRWPAWSARWSAATVEQPDREVSRGVLPDRAGDNGPAMRSLIGVGAWQLIPLFLIEPAEALQVEAAPVVERDAFRFQQAPLEGVAAIAG